MQLAQVKNPILPPALNPATGEPAATAFQGILAAIIRVFFVAGGLLFFFILLIGAIRWITSGGDKAQIESARSTILNALVGFVILMSLFAITAVISNLFGLSLLKFDIGELSVK